MSEISERAAEIRQRWQEKQDNPSSIVTEEEALNIGIIHPEEEGGEEPPSQQQPQETTNTDTQASDYTDTPPEEKQYKKLSKWDTTKDIAASVGVEALHFFQPKSRETQYESQTHFGENMKYTYRYVVGTAAFIGSFFTGTGEVAAGAALVKGATMLPKLSGAMKLGEGLIKLGNGINKANKLNKVANPLKAGLKAARAGKSVKAAIIMEGIKAGALDGLFASPLASFTLYRPEEKEGHFADLFPENTPILSLLQTKETDSAFDARLKEAANDFLVGIPFGAVLGGSTTALSIPVKRWFRNVHKTVHAKTAEEAAEGLGDIIQSKIPIDNITKTMDMVAEVDNIIKEASETNQEVSQLIIDRFPTTKIDEAKAIAKFREAGETIFPYEDGTWSITVNNWEDAYKVTPEQYKYQLASQDSTGNLAISHMNDAVESTWKQRNLIDGEGLRSTKSIERTNTTNAILDYYKNKWDLGKSKISIKYGDWSEIPDGKITQYNNGNIFIQINKNSKDIYATLRSELEHARDLIKGEKPLKAEIEGSGEHWARYKGDNEAEIAPDFVYKKSSNRAEAIKLEEYKPIDKKELDNYSLSSVKNDAFGENPDVIEEDYQPFTIYSLRDKNGKVVAHTRMNGSYALWGSNTGTEHGAARKLVAKILYENKLPYFVWEAATKKSVDSYKKFCKEFPDLIDRVQYIDTWSKNIDNKNPLHYNQATGGITDGKEGTDISNLQGNQQGVGKDRSLDISENGENIQRTSRDSYETAPSRDTTQSNPTINERGENTLINAQGQQLKLDFSVSTPQSIGESIAKGDIKLTDGNNVEEIINHIINTDVEISGKTFKDVANDADSYFNKAMNNDPMSAAAYLNAQSPEVLDGIVRQQLAAVKLASVLRDIQAKATPKENLKILSAVKQLDKYITGVGSGFGRGLRYQSVVKKAVNIFGSENFSELALQGISDIADILDTISLNFTRNQSLKEFKAECLKAFQTHPAYNEIVGNRPMFSKVNDILDETYNKLKAGEKVDPSELIMETLMRDEAETCGWYAKLTKNTQGFIDTIKNWKGKRFSNLYTNVLGVSSVINQTVGTTTMTAANPTYKIIGGILNPVTDLLNPFVSKKTSFLEAKELTQEGVDELTSKLTSLYEALDFSFQAFLKGDGLLTNTKTMTENGLEGFQPFVKAFDRESIFQNVSNLWELFPRLLMAEDEFFNQLNYRSIIRGKALAQARREAEVFGKDFNLYERADNIFKEIAFDQNGKPLDFAAYNEAKELTFQTPLSRKQYNPKTGNVEETAHEQSLIAQFGESIQNLENKYTFLKPFNLFVKTPTNIVDYATDSIPVLNLLKKDVRARFTSKDPMVRAKMVGQTAVTGMIGLLAAFEAAKGNITGSAPLDRATKTALLKTGWRPYSIRIGDKWVSYMGKIPAFDSVLAFAADCVSMNNDINDPEKQLGWGEVANRIFASIVNDYLDQTSYRTGAEKVLDIFNPETDVDRKSKVLATLGQEFLPQSSNIKTIKTLGKHEKQKAEGFYPTLVQNYTELFVPAQDYQRDVFGNRIDQFGLLIAKATDDKFMQPEYAELARLAEKGYSPSNIGNMLKKTSVPLEEFKSIETGRSAYDAMYDELTNVKISGKTLQEAVAALIETPRYKSVPDGIASNGVDWNQTSYKTKTKLLNDVYLRYYNIAKKRVINNRGDEFLDKDGKTMKQKQQDVRLESIKQFTKQTLEQNVSDRIIRIGQ